MCIFIKLLLKFYALMMYNYKHDDGQRAGGGISYEGKCYWGHRVCRG